MQDKAVFRGSYTALITPFADGAVDYAALRALVDWQIDSGTHGLVPVGTTGESPTLSHEEHKKVVETVIRQAAGRVPVIAGAGSNNTREAVELCRHAEEAGADGVLVVTPYYNKPNQLGLYEHFKAVSEAISLPIIVYNIPPRSVVDMSVDTLARLAQLQNIVGVKDATGNVGRILQQRAAIGPQFVQFCGDDILALASVAVGAIGVISVVSNIAPRLCADMQNAALSGDFSAALAIQDRLTALQQAVFLEAGVTGAKYGLSLLGRSSEDVRLPLVPSSEATKAAIRAAMVHAGLIG
ncbi:MULTISPECIES: 4-hydroxy-tetrahydrodipicolinate synthase [Methylosinus]|uniref:4-hydroxy-tetrahydrodipicolinate synthase n=1 Tax=Methylosinus trichosporium (strain ATCC 35070 / NCIMB 11131 / UNIQEM 75 / OB3b) TaxID=595536 RepID=A0A2D2D1A1_METT3|nr:MULTISPECIES: 4-hydroxy-tetrahydrodipicolinate synthase [Methylosinus]ATQ68762.1 4-hydroxy-tetrahydrodipicolinate synthase [Methylosinus trichosporium OB3b]OBS53076.1 4-hydroxy-tetrahydrodipicolinate synthase [Methylosinus sp. 3S-1]